MMLTSRSSARIPKRLDQCPSISPIDDDNQKEKRRQRPGLLWHQSMDTTWTRGITVLLLVMANALVYFNPATSSIYRSSCPDPLSSFTAWRWYHATQQYEQTLLPQQQPYRSRRNFPSVRDRAHLAMGLWWEPQLHGVPPLSPFHGIVIPAQQHKGVFPLDMEHPRDLYVCATEGSGSNAQGNLCSNAFVRHVAYDALDASLLVQEYQQRSTFLHYWNVAKYEGILGWVTEWSQPAATRWQAKPVYLWNYGVTVATPQWNTAVPVFGRVRDAVAANEGPVLCNRRPGGPSLHSTILWPSARNKEQVAQVLENDVIPWDQKSGDFLYWRGNAELGSERRKYLEFYQSSNVVDMKHNVFPENSFAVMLKETLQYKYLLVLEGNDVPEDLLWKLYSNSIVFMPPPSYVSWAMETMLEPWKHYIPVNRTNLAQRLRWAQSHPEQARQIAEQSTRWVYDLYFHPQAARDDEYVMRIIIHRYQQFVMRAKPIIKWSDVYQPVAAKCRMGYDWMTEDWLRMAFVAVALLRFSFR